MTMADSRDQDGARPPARFCQVLRARLRDVQGDDLGPPGDQMPSEAADFPSENSPKAGKPPCIHA